MKTPDISKILEIIRGGKKTTAELTNIHDNALKLADNEKLSESDLEMIVSEVENSLRLYDSRSANRIFGSKNRDTKQNLEKFFEHLTDKYDLLHNRHKNGVKCGGNVMRGEAHIYDYLSYKNSSDMVAHISYFQESIISELMLRVWYCDVSEQNDTSNQIEFSAGDFEAAKELYEVNLAKALG